MRTPDRIFKLKNGSVRLAESSKKFYFTCEIILDSGMIVQASDETKLKAFRRAKLRLKCKIDPQFFEACQRLSVRPFAPNIYEYFEQFRQKPPKDETHDKNL